MDGLREVIEGQPLSRSKIAEHLEDIARAARDDARATDSTLKAAELRRFNHAKPPPRPEARFLVSGVTVATPGNLVAIAAAPKGGKSAFIGGMIAATVTQEPEGKDFLGVESHNPNGLAMLHFDTEQSPYDHWQLISRSIRRAGIKDPPPWLGSWCVTGMPIPETRSLISEAAEHAVREFGGIHSILIDGAADLVADVNDPEESNAFVAGLHGMAIQWNCPIIGVIHVNPGSEKTRGHLGSQLERKAESNLRIERDGDVCSVWADKNRGAPLSKYRGPSFSWSNELGMHVSVASIGETKSSAKRAELHEEASRAFEHARKAALSWGDLIDAIRESSVIGKSGARKKLAAMQKAGVVAKNGALGTYTLTR